MISPPCEFSFYSWPFVPLRFPPPLAPVWHAEPLVPSTALPKHRGRPLPPLLWSLQLPMTGYVNHALRPLLLSVAQVGATQSSVHPVEKIVGVLRSHMLGHAANKAL